MSLTRNDIELLAPAGSFDSLQAAIQGGANAIYFGLSRLNMRAKAANNFDLKDLKEITSICKENNLKSYLTVNVTISDANINIMREIIDAAQQAGVSAIIASDQAVISYAFSQGMPLHLSTQLNISNVETIKFYSNFADAIVLSRELSLSQINSIVKQIDKENIIGTSGKPIRIEIFAHGALCMAISGKCHLSLHESNASANKGLCVQNCRRSYVVTDKETGNELEIDNEYIMSASDLCTIDFIDKILETGTKILKLEGRGRSPEYVKTVSQCYNEALNAYFDGSYSIEKINKWKERLTMVYNRGFWDGYYLGREIGKWSKTYGSQATKRKIYIGKGIKYFDKIKIGEFLLEAGNLKLGDDILITGSSTGVVETKVNELRVNLDPASFVEKGTSFSMPVDTKIRPSDKLYKVVSVANTSG